MKIFYDHLFSERSKDMAEGNKDIVLSIRGMSKSFGRNKVLKHIDMDVPRGSIMGLMARMVLVNRQ